MRSRNRIHLAAAVFVAGVFSFVSATAQHSHFADSPAFALDLRENVAEAITVRVRDQSGAVPPNAGSNVFVERIQSGVGFVDFRNANSQGEVVYAGTELDLGASYTFFGYNRNPQSPFGQTDEWWSGASATATASPQTVTMQRNLAHVEWVRFYVNGVEVPPGGSVAVGSTVTWQARVVSQYPIAYPTRVTLWLDRSRGAPIDHAQTSSYQVTGGSGGAVVFNGSMVLTAEGTYARTILTEVEWDGTIFATDSYQWDNVFTVGPPAQMRIVDFPVSAKAGDEFTVRVLRTNPNGTVDDVTTTTDFSGTDSRLNHLGGGNFRVAGGAATGPAAVVAQLGELYATAFVDVLPGAELPQIAISDLRVDGRVIAMEQEYRTGHKHGQPLKVSFMAENVGPTDLAPGDAAIEFEVDFSDSFGQGDTSLAVLETPGFFPAVATLGISSRTEGNRRIYRVTGLRSTGIWRQGQSAQFEFLIRGPTMQPMEIEMRVATEATANGVTFRNPQGPAGGFIRPFRSLSGWLGNQILLRFISGGQTRSVSYEATFTDADVADIHADVMTVLFIDGSIQMVVAVSNPRQTWPFALGAASRYAMVYDIAGNYFKATLDGDRSLIVRPRAEGGASPQGWLVPMSDGDWAVLSGGSSGHWLFDQELEILLVENNRVLNAATLTETPPEEPQLRIFGATLRPPAQPAVSVDFFIRGTSLAAEVASHGYSDGDQATLGAGGAFSFTLEAGVLLEGHFDGELVEAQIVWQTGEEFTFAATAATAYGLGASWLHWLGDTASFVYPIGEPETMSTDADWISDLAYDGVSGSITFSVAQNPHVEAREASILVDGGFVHRVRQERGITGPLPDFGIMLFVDPPHPRVGELLYLAAAVYNKGNAGGDAGRVGFSRHAPDPMIPGLLDADQVEVVGWLDPGELEFVEIVLPADEAGRFVCRAMVDPPPGVAESDRANNEASLVYTVHPSPDLEMADWLDMVGIPVGQRLPNHRHGPLGLSNLEAYAMGLPPFLAGAANLPRAGFADAEAGHVAFHYHRNSEARGIRQWIEASHDLRTWWLLTPDWETVHGVVAGVEAVEAVFSTSGREPLFLRLSMEKVRDPEMVLVEGGPLSTSNELDGTEVETFYIGRYEVTWGEWKRVRAWGEANGYQWNGPDGLGREPSGCADDHPVHTVNWYDVVKWSNAKSEMEDLTPVYRVDGEVYRSGEPNNTTITQNLSANGYRLPLEAEWEFAARGGNQTQGYTYAGSNDLNAVGWFRDNSGGAACDLSSGYSFLPPGLGTWPVGHKAANELGLYDMTGNVSEWCWDQYEIWPSYRRMRGASLYEVAHHCTVSSRSFDSSDFRWDTYGFRLARSSVPDEHVSMVVIPAGTYARGDHKNEPEWWMERARPVHDVSVSAFYMAQTPVTYAEWREVYDWAVANGYTFDNPGQRGSNSSGNALSDTPENNQHPVTRVNWYDVVKWCNAKSEREGITPVYYTNHARTTVYRQGRHDVTIAQVNWSANGYRLPTEAEWEKAARGGLVGARWPWGDAEIDGSRANYRDSGGTNGTTPVGSYAANGYGLYDMAGNVYEWNWDWYSDTWYSQAGATEADTRGPVSGSHRVFRGGSWFNNPVYSRVAYRGRDGPGYQWILLGFRLARTQ